jgi:hypothetical protein
MNLSLGNSWQPGSVSDLDLARPLGERIIYIIVFLVPELLLFKAIFQTSAGTACLPYLQLPTRYNYPSKRHFSGGAPC